MWALIEQEKTLMYWRNITFIYHNDFSKYMKVKGATSKDIFHYPFDVRVRKFLSEKEKKHFQ